MDNPPFNDAVYQVEFLVLIRDADLDQALRKSLEIRKKLLEFGYIVEVRPISICEF